MVAGASGDTTDSIVPALVGASATLLLVVALAPRLASVSASRALGLRAAPLDVYAAAALGTVMLGPTGDTLMSLAADVLPTATFGTPSILNEAAAATPVAVALVSFAILPGVSEELLFRGLLQNAAPRGARAVLVSGIVFALFHVDPHHVIGVLPLGLFLAWVGERAGTWVTIGAHTVNNALAVLVARTGALDVGYGSEHPIPWTWVAASLVTFAGTSRYLARRAPVRPATAQAAAESQAVDAPERPTGRSQPRTPVEPGTPS
jgi:membrane protease YdiL (CAAX protease family)